MNTNSQVSGCDGSCCVAFTMSSNLGELVLHGGDIHHKGNALEWFTILSMIEPLTPDEAQERMERFGVELEAVSPREKRYKCRHWDEETRLCGIYDGRPWMCRTYPNLFNGLSWRCVHCNCAGGEACYPMPLYTRMCLGVQELERDRRRRAKAAA